MLILSATINHLVRRLLALLDINLTLTEEYTLVRRKSRSASKSRSRSRSRVQGRSKSRSRIPGQDRIRKKGVSSVGQLGDTDGESGNNTEGGVGTRRSDKRGQRLADDPDTAEPADQGEDEEGAEANEQDDEDEEEEMKETTFYRAKMYRDSIMPEVAILAAWITVMKMVYGLDDEER